MDILGSGQVQAIDNKAVVDELHSGCTKEIENEARQVRPKSAAQNELKRIKMHGGKRPGAGRKPNPTKLLRGVSKEALADAVPDIDIAAVVAGLLRSKREVIRLQALNFLYDRMLGKPKQDVTVAGGIVHAHTRDPFLASPPKEALEMLARSYDEVVAKYSLPAPQDGPQNQVESKPSIEVIEIGCAAEGEPE